MTKKELSQFYYLKKEIKEQQRRLAELEAVAINCSTEITGLPTGTGISDKIGNYAAQKHVKTGSMAKSVKCSKPTINHNGDAVGRVKFYGKDKNGMLNWYKGIWIEYGAKNQPAQPFVRPAIKSCESSVRAAMQKVFNRRVAGANSRSK